MSAKKIFEFDLMSVQSLFHVVEYLYQFNVAWICNTLATPENACVCERVCGWMNNFCAFVVDRVCGTDETNNSTNHARARISLLLIDVCKIIDIRTGIYLHPPARLQYSIIIIIGGFCLPLHLSIRILLCGATRRTHIKSSWKNAEEKSSMRRWKMGKWENEQR